MKIVFFGSADFAVPSLEKLLDSQHEVQAAVTQPDRKKGRHLNLQATPVKVSASSKGVKTYQPEKIQDGRFLRPLKGLRADLFIVVAFGQILPKNILDIPKIYSINLHASLLPRYRGAAPVNWAVINGETKTGLTVIKMNARMDAGDIILQRSVEIEKEDTSETLSSRLSNLGAVLLLDAVRFIEEDRVTFEKQDEKKATFAPRLKKEDGLIDWGRNAAEIHNRIKGTVPWPGAYTYFDKKKINIWKTVVLDGDAGPGEIVKAQKELIIGTGKGLLQVEEVQTAGKKRMSVADFLRGFRELKKGSIFSSA